MIWGITAAIICVFLYFKLIARKLKWHTVEAFLRKIHNPCGIFVLVVITVHFLLTLDVWSTRSVMVVATGIITAVLLLYMAVGYCFRKKIKSKWILLHRKIAFFIVFFSICHIILYYVDFFSYKSNISTINVTGMDASNAKDGSYEGEYDAGYIYAKVSITVNNGQILNIVILEHDNERGTPAEKIVSNIIEQQNTKVDAISGATNSSLVIEKAVENALAKGE